MGPGLGACLISAGTALPTSFPCSKPGCEEARGKPRGKHGLQCGVSCFPPPLVPMLPAHEQANCGLRASVTGPAGMCVRVGVGDGGVAGS